MEGQDMEQPAEDVNAGDTPGDIVEDVQESVVNDAVAGTNVSQNDISMGDAAGCPTELCNYCVKPVQDEPVAAHSISFDASGEKLYCGFNKMIRVFDVASPGRSFDERPTNVKKMGQPGIISCFAFGPQGIYAAGSYCKTVAMYSESDGQLQFMLSGHQGGVTHLRFSPDGTRLYSGGRKDFEILCWDLRNLGKVLFCMKRTVTTHQRMYFDLSRCGNYLLSGNTNGIVTAWDLKVQPIELDDCEPLMRPGLFFKAHDDCVNGISAAGRLADVQVPQHHSGRPGGRPGPRGAVAPLSVRLRRGVLAARNGGGEACQDGGLRIRARSSLSRGHAGALGPAAGAPFG
ncbi:hypothetical protein HPB47_005481 [Ixodes persulcatus]|uniref:Uncharacterized protein n=1 Tax=Ixodes persulcatus TaxID=34615 RepID=A0AC60PCU6_IXOPE|nr:hypothetical protein HPB47_005481 [Ixodes persulcatus]